MTQPRKTLRSIEDLAGEGLLARADVPPLEAVAARYAVAVTPEMAALVDRDATADPIARQFIPDARELVTGPEEHADPIGDRPHEKVPGLIHRYPDRVLLKVTHSCPVYCRFCFRRETVGPAGAPPMGGRALDEALAYIAAHPGIFEVILTGGDPLVLSPRRIRELTERLGAIRHVKAVRWHTRVPVVDPSRVTAELCAALSATTTAVWLGVHANHPRELMPEAREAIGRLRSAGLSLVSQTVLLRGVNDDAATLAELFRGFVALGVKPYYLHHADLAPGTSHFRTTLAEGQAIMRTLRGRISGLALPTYVLDIPGGHGKVSVGPDYVDTATGRVTDNSGTGHLYPPARL
ncbi:MAG: lysine-2,3-aminomutase-like protein [Hyphomicrobiaceae bacterium]|nr:lysine-2,3-aminomutase-like protein [Hyphomicrobiaceae bacterium]